MHSLWPLPTHTPPPELTDEQLEDIYAYPPELDRAWVQANFVSSADGAVSVDERSDGLSSPADKRIFALGRDLADVVLVGAGTAEKEGYKGVRATERRLGRRRAMGLADVPPIAVVSGRCALPADAGVLTRTEVAPLVITTEAAPRQRRDALAAAGAEIVLAGSEHVDLPAALDELCRRGLRKVNCEGGPQLFGSLLAADLVDQLCLTVAPLLAGAGAGRIVEGPAAAPRDMRLASVLHEDGHCMFRYRRA